MGPNTPKIISAIMRLSNIIQDYSGMFHNVENIVVDTQMRARNKMRIESFDLRTLRKCRAISTKKNTLLSLAGASYQSHRKGPIFPVDDPTK